jgi:hypothetical protein
LLIRDHRPTKRSKIGQAIRKLVLDLSRDPRGSDACKSAEHFKGKSRWDEPYDRGVLIAEVVVQFRSMICRLHLIEDVEHAHSTGTDVAIFSDRDLSGCGLRLDVLGDRAEELQAVSQERSRRIGRSRYRPALSRSARSLAFAVSRRASRPTLRAKKQGRRRSIPSTTLPAPDIEIGSRHPVDFRMPGILTGMCEPVHIRRGKLAKPRRWRGSPSWKGASWAGSERRKSVNSISSAWRGCGWRFLTTGVLPWPTVCAAGNRPSLRRTACWHRIA